MKRLLMLMLLAAPVGAVEPGEQLADGALEVRARALSQELRCLVCRNESIDESNAELARDLRILVRERLLAGDTDVAALAFIVDRYGEYVLLRPQTNGSNLILWIGGPAMLLLAFLIAGLSLRGQRRGPDDVLSDEDQARLGEILKD